MKTINKRLEALEEQTKPKDFLVLWGDRRNPDICRVDGEVYSWPEAKQKFGEDYFLICVNYVERKHEND
jgi:hypothetical protein